MNPITMSDLVAALNSPHPPQLVEALPSGYYLDAHLPGAINIPHDRVDELAAELLPDRSAAIVVYCANGPCPNSAIAARRLTQLAYTDVRDYHEGTPSGSLPACRRNPEPASPPRRTRRKDRP